MRCVDLFAGCGGLSLGFQKAGFEVCAAFDNWPQSIEVYKNNFSHPIFQQDLADESGSIKKIRPFKPELIMGGPPCQDFSSAGKRDTRLGRADLTIHFAKIVCGIKPAWFVMENVEQIKKSAVLRSAVSVFREAGYGLSAAILDASYCGVPQARTRFFLIGKLGAAHNKLVPFLKRKLAQRPMTLRDYFGDSLGLQYYYRHPRNYNRRAVFSIDEPSPTVRGVNRPVPAGYKLNSCDPKGVDLRRIRPLTTIERSRVQTFPKRFRYIEGKTNVEQMIGNAVPINLARFVAQAIKDFCESEGGLSEDLFESVLDSRDAVNPFVIPSQALHRNKSGLIARMPARRKMRREACGA
jgi:DNA (cytosine-5)-methyltransferase 1